MARSYHEGHWDLHDAHGLSEEKLMINLYDNATNEMVGTINLEQLIFLMDQLEEESIEDRDYYINRATLDFFEAEGADPELMNVLRTALGDQDEMEFRWQHA